MQANNRILLLNFASVSSGLLSALLLIVTFFQMGLSEDTLAESIHHNARLLVNSAQADRKDLDAIVENHRDNNPEIHLENQHSDISHIFDNSLNNPRNFLDHKTDQPLYLKFSKSSETFILWDVSLTHVPGASLKAVPVEKFPDSVSLAIRPILYKEKSDFAGIRKAVFSVYLRQANDPDKENHMPEPTLIHSEIIELAEDIKSINLKMPDFKKLLPGSSEKYPHNVFLILAKLKVKEIYPGRVFKDIISLKELPHSKTGESL
jgi:hypothetical protein